MQSIKKALNSLLFGVFASAAATTSVTDIAAAAAVNAAVLHFARSFDFYPLLLLLLLLLHTSHSRCVCASYFSFSEKFSFFPLACLTQKLMIKQSFQTHSTKINLSKRQNKNVFKVSSKRNHTQNYHIIYSNICERECEREPEHTYSIHKHVIHCTGNYTRSNNSSSCCMK